MIGLHEIVMEVFGKTYLFQGFVMMGFTVLLLLLVSRNTKKLMFLAPSVAVGVLLMGVQPSYAFLIITIVFYFVAIWSNEMDAKLIEFSQGGY